MNELHTSVVLTEVTVSAVPTDNINWAAYSVSVQWRQGDQYVVTRWSRFLDADGVWSYPPDTRPEHDAWRAAHRFDYKTALDLATEAARHIVVNGYSVQDALSEMRRWDGA